MSGARQLKDTWAKWRLPPGSRWADVVDNNHRPQIGVQVPAQLRSASSHVLGQVPLVANSAESAIGPIGQLPPVVNSAEPSIVGEEKQGNKSKKLRKAAAIRIQLEIENLCVNRKSAGMFVCYSPSCLLLINSTVKTELATFFIGRTFMTIKLNSMLFAAAEEKQNVRELGLLNIHKNLPFDVLHNHNNNMQLTLNQHGVTHFDTTYYLCSVPFKRLGGLDIGSIVYANRDVYNTICELLEKVGDTSGLHEELCLLKTIVQFVSVTSPTEHFLIRFQNMGMSLL